MLHMCMVYESKPTVVLEPIVQGCSSTSLARTLRGEMANQKISESTLKYLKLFCASKASKAST